MKARIGIDLRCLTEGRKTGVEEYAERMAKALIVENPEKRIIIFINSFKGDDSNLKWIKKYSNTEIKKFNFPNKILNLSFWLLGWPKIDKLLGGVDLFFMPNISFGALSQECCLVLTAHDLSFERFPEFFSYKRRIWHFLVNPKRWFTRADQIWAVSKSTKEDLVSLYNIEENKIKIPSSLVADHCQPLYEGLKIDQEKKEKAVEKYQLPSRFILFLGTLEPRKNLVSVIRAFNFIKKRNDFKDLKLVVAGKKGWLWKETEKCFLDSSFRNDIIFTDFIEESDKLAVYGLAEVFVFVSFFEGFGYPPLEAMAAGTPVVASNCSSLPEIVDDSAVLVDPYSFFEIAQAIELLLNDKRVYKKYVKKGRQNIERIITIESKTKKLIESLLEKK
jgi:glycosyltransferase involved in cell wall biosynthesis